MSHSTSLEIFSFGSYFGWCGTCVKDAEKDDPGFCNHNEAAVSTDDKLIKKGVLNSKLRH